MNLIWGINNKYAGSLREVGSLRYYFSLLDKVRLNTKKPDFHALLSALRQILDGLLLHTWQLECGFTLLTQFSASNPTPALLLDIAKRILLKYATPLEDIEELKQKKKAQMQSSKPNSDSDTDSDIEPEASHAPMQLDPSKDVINQNVRLLTRELLYIVEVVQAITDGGFRRVEDIYPNLSRIF